MASRPALIRRLLAACIAVLVALTFAGAYFLDRRFLLFLLPPSLTYFLIDAVRDAKHQKELQAALDAKREAREAAEAAGEAAPGERAPRQPGVNNKKNRRARAA